jgi:dihydropteroate synthase
VSFFEALSARRRALVMGVLNVTPDSFSDGGLHADVAAAERAAREMLAQGADLVDVGGESTRPGATAVPPEEEERRVLPLLERLRGLPVSVDTRRGRLAARALALGAALVNDVSAGADPALLEAVAGAGAGILLMHMRGEPGSMQDDPRYRDVVGEVEAFLLARARAAEAAGIPRERILLDPGIGFGKTSAHNWALLRALPRLAGHGYPLAVGLSRKRFLGDATGRAVSERRDATVAAGALAAFHGAAMLRVHDVPAGVDAAEIAARWRGGIAGGAPSPTR